ncbi:hypothetical protein D3C81_1616990 [compost metagenome]
MSDVETDDAVRVLHALADDGGKTPAFFVPQIHTLVARHDVSEQTERLCDSRERVVEDVGDLRVRGSEVALGNARKLQSIDAHPHAADEGLTAAVASDEGHELVVTFDELKLRLVQHQDRLHLQPR